MQKNIVIQLRLWNATGRNILTGLLKRISYKDNYAIRIAGDADELRRILPSACALIADTSADEALVASAIADGKCVVLVNDWRFPEAPANVGHVRTDDGRIGFKAAEYLMSIGRFRSFGFVPAYAAKEWSAKRGRAFSLQLRRRGQKCDVFSHDPTDSSRLAKWLRELPKPAAVFCAWDSVAAEVASTAKEAGVKMPSQVVLLGVDNDEVYCMTASPHLSSIEFDSENEGKVAMDMLQKMLSARKRRHARSVCCGGVKRIVERESTHAPAPAACLVERAVKYIAENATKGITPADVAADLGVSRTLLDLRLR